MKRTVLSLLLLLALLLPLPSRADVIFEPMDDFYAAHAEQCEYVNDRYLSPGGVPGVVSPENPSELCVFPSGWELDIPFQYEDAQGVVWGVYEEGEESCWVRLDALQKIFDGADFQEKYADAIQSYAGEMDGVSLPEIVYLWTYPGSGEVGGKLLAEEIAQADTPPYDAVYLDESGQTWVYIPYFYGMEGWICREDPGSADLAATAPEALAEKPEVEPVITTLPAIRPLAAAGRTRLYLTVGAVAAVVAVSAVLLAVFFRRKKR